MKKLAIMKLAALAIVLGLSVSITGCGEGDPGPQGEQGKPGLDGKDGIDGDDGQDGADGKDSPNKSFYFQYGFKGYTGAVDNFISSLYPTTNYGNEKQLWISYNANGEPKRYIDPIIRFDDIDETILPYLDNPDTEGSADDFYINQAVLYLYCYNPSSTFEGNLQLQLTFYDDEDPIFAENISTWNSANEVQPWAGGAGGLSNGYWASVFINGHFVGLPNVNNLGGSMGWIAVPLPRQVVKSWISDAGNLNKGLRIRLYYGYDESASATLLCYSNEYEVEDLRPLLFVNGEPADTNAGGRVAQQSWKERLAEWESMSYSDKMAPLHIYLSSK